MKTFDKILMSINISKKLQKQTIKKIFKLRHKCFLFFELTKMFMIYIYLLHFVANFYVS